MVVTLAIYFKLVKQDFGTTLSSNFHMLHMWKKAFPRLELPKLLASVFQLQGWNLAGTQGRG